MATTTTISPIWKPFCTNPSRDSIHVSHAKGAYLYSTSGKSYFDGISSWWVNLHGHTHPSIVSAIQNQVEKLEHVMFADFAHSPAYDLANRLVKILPGTPGKVFFSDNGSTAVEVAIKLAIQHSFIQKGNNLKKKILCFSGGYHGDTIGAMSASGKSAFTTPFESYLLPSVSIPPPFKESEEETINACKRAIQNENILCFIYEPIVQGASGMRMYSPEALNEVLYLCKRAGVITIADEIMTGFYRTGKAFASEYLHVDPDIICLAKGLTGGFLPLGVTTCRNDFYSTFIEDTKNAFLHGHTYTANPIACASANANLDLTFTTLTLSSVATITKQHQLFVSKHTGHPALKRCESVGTILALDFKLKDTSYFSRFKEKVQDYLLEKGVFLRPIGSCLYVLPPYCTTKEELQSTYQNIEHILEKADEFIS
jgi:adenosylmethionine-8-amino-7-oxononanoate aminotransferase